MALSAVRLSLPTGYAPPTSAPRVAAWGGAVGSDTAASLTPGQKLLHFVRHAQGFHNIDQSVMKTEAGRRPPEHALASRPTKRPPFFAPAPSFF